MRLCICGLLIISSRITSGLDIRLCTIGLSNICRNMSGLDIICCCICDCTSAKLELPKPRVLRPERRSLEPLPPPNGRLNKLLNGFGWVGRGWLEGAVVWFDAGLDEDVAAGVLCSAFYLKYFIIWKTNWFKLASKIFPSAFELFKRNYKKLKIGEKFSFFIEILLNRVKR